MRNYLNWKKCFWVCSLWTFSRIHGLELTDRWTSFHRLRALLVFGEIWGRILTVEVCSTVELTTEASPFGPFNSVAPERLETDPLGSNWLKWLQAVACSMKPLSKTVQKYVGGSLFYVIASMGVLEIPFSFSSIRLRGSETFQGRNKQQYSASSCLKSKFKTFLMLYVQLV